MGRTNIKTMNYNHFKPLVFAIIMFLLCSCGSSDDDNGTGAEVTDLAVGSTSLQLGEQTVVAVKFTYSADDIFDNGENVVVVVKLPNGVSLVEGTSEVDSIFGDEEVTPSVNVCKQTGESFVIYDLDESDLDLASNPDGDADAKLNFTIRGVRTTDGEVLLEARAENNSVLYTCDQFSSDAQIALTVIQ